MKKSLAFFSSLVISVFYFKIHLQKLSNFVIDKETGLNFEILYPLVISAEFSLCIVIRSLIFKVRRISVSLTTLLLGCDLENSWVIIVR